MSQSKTSESVSNYKCKEASDIFSEKKTDPPKNDGGSGAVDQAVDKLRTNIKGDSNGETRCSSKESNGVENGSFNSINDADIISTSNDGTNGTLEHSVHIDISSLNVTSDSIASSGDVVVGAAAAVVSIGNDRADEDADYRDLTTPNSDDGSIVDEDDGDPDWGTDNSDENDEDGEGGGDDGEVYDSESSYGDIDPGYSDTSIDEYDMSKSVLEAIQNEKLERNTFKFIFQQRADMAADDLCPVCLLSFVDAEEVRRLPCFHVFHTSCVDPWLKEHKKVCPKCRISIKVASDYLNESAL